MQSFLGFCLSVISFLGLSGCSTHPLQDEFVVASVDLPKFMGRWYVMAGRFTFLEKNVHNAIESYSWNSTENRIDIAFTYNQGSFNGEVKSLPQKGWVYNASNSHWKVSPLWPFKFDYLIIDLAEDYSWTVIGVPDQKYVWIMARDYKISADQIKTIIQRLESKKYNTSDIINVPHQY